MLAADNSIKLLNVENQVTGSTFIKNLKKKFTYTTDNELDDIQISIGDKNLRINRDAVPYSIKHPRYSNKFSSVESIVLGPVIGLVTQNSAKILIQTNVSGVLLLQLRGHNKTMRENHIPDTKVINVEADIPKTFIVKNLKPGYTYDVKFNLPYLNIVHSEFTTLSDNMNLEENPIKIALVSGDQVYVIEEKPYERAPKDLAVKVLTHSTEESLWKDLYHRIKEERITYVLHLGNNINIGSRDDKKSLFSELMYSNVQFEDAVLAIRDHYMKIWNEPWTKHVLANCSNIMVCNETDIGRMFQSLEGNSDERAWNIAEAAYKCYSEYQQSLITKKEKKENGVSMLQTNSISLTDNVQLLIVDWRTSPTFKSREKNTPVLLGKQNLNFIEKSLMNHTVSANAVYPKSRNVILISSVQICHRSSFVHAPAFRSDTEKLLNILFDFKASGPKNTREVSIVSSATSEAGMTAANCQIKQLKSGLTIKEWVVGPISGPTLSTTKLNSFCSNSFQFRLTRSLQNNNYAVLTISQKFRPTEDKNDADINETFLVCSPTNWVEYYFSAPSKKLKNLEFVYSGINNLLKRSLLDNSLA